MELKYRFVLYIGFAAAVLISILLLIKKKKQTKYADGVKLANTYVLDKDDYYLEKIKLYKAFSVGMALSLIVSILCTTILCARPYERKKIVEDKYCRDIILCLDVSTSVDELNAKLMGELIDMVGSLEKERFGIVIFNTSPVLLTPLTDDYEYIQETLGNIEKAMKNRVKMYNSFFYPDDWYYWESYISDGTLVGNEERGSSLIGDGLAATVNNFSSVDEDRTKIVIFTTDNDPYGKEIVPLKTAAEICKQRGITVYGIGTKEMTSHNMKEMKNAMEVTGGEFFLEEESGTFDAIVKRIESHSESLVPGDTYYVDLDRPRGMYILTLISVICVFLFARLLRE